MDNIAISPTGEGLKWMHPKDIKFTETSISHEFRRTLLKRNNEPGLAGISYTEALNRTQSLSLRTTVQQLRDGGLKVTNIPSIRVVFHQESWYSLDNRRLWVFKEFGEEIPVVIEKAEKDLFQKLVSRVGDGDSVTFINAVEAEKHNEHQTLLSQVLRWSLKEVMDEGLLVNRVKLIPVRFGAVDKYLAAFRWPLVEETRAQLQHAFEELDTASYVSLNDIQEMTYGREHPEDSRLKTFELSQDNTTFISGGGKKGQPHWKPKPMDLILLANVLPKNGYPELQRPGVWYTLGVVKGSREEDDALSFKAEVYAPSASPEHQALLKREQQWYAIQLGTIATSIRIWEALHQSFPTGCSETLDVPVLSETLCPLEETPLSNVFVERCSETGEQEIDRYCVYRGLNESQASAVRTSILGLLREERPFVRLIQGPPGTGKTSTLTSLLSILTSLNRTTLVCAATNVAVSEVAVRFLKFFDTINHVTNNLQFGVFLKLHGMELEGTTVDPVQLGDLVLVGNKDRLDVRGPLGRIYLDDRVDRLTIALSNVGGWRDSADSMLQLLKTPYVQYTAYCDIHHKGSQVHSSFGTFLQTRLEKLAGKFTTSIRILLMDLPSTTLPPSMVEQLETSSSLLAMLLGLVDYSKLKDASSWFGKSSSSLNEPLSNSGTLEQFLDTKEKLRQVLDNLLDEFGGLAQTPSINWRTPSKNWQRPSQTPSRKWLQNLCLQNAKLVFSTVSSAGRPCVQSLSFECVIVDEASQCVEAETVIVTSMKGLKQLILVGDHMQLPATVISQVAKECEYGRSLFERLKTLEHPSHLLNVQYRMHPAISLFPHMQFYGGQVQNGHNVVEENYGNKNYQEILRGPYAFININDGNEQNESTSWKNVVEVEIVLYLVKMTRNVCKEAKVLAPSIGIISPYRGQVENLERRLRYISDNTNDVEVRSVDGFQGREKDLIIFSTVRSNSAGRIGFLKDSRRLNVAITRAKHCMWIVGNAHTLANSKNSVWEALIVNAKQRNCFINPDDDMIKIIRRVKAGLNRIADLLDPNSILFKNLLWKVLFAKDLKTTISEIQSVEIKQRLLYMVLNLAGGKRPRYSTEANVASERYRQLIQVQRVADLYLVWTIDVERWPNPRQIIKVWDAIKNSQLAHLIKRLEGGYRICTQAYLDRCKEKIYDTRTKLVVPAEWVSDPFFTWYKLPTDKQKTDISISPPGTQDADADAALENSAVDESIRLMKFYSLSYTGIVHQFLTASNGSQIELPFEVNEQEAAIVHYPRSSFIIGRSGTGKTTVITTKILQREQDFGRVTNGISEDVDGIPKGSDSVSDRSQVLRQALITLSPKLCAAVKHNIAKTRRTMQAAEGGKADLDDYEEMMLDDEAESKLMGCIPDNFSNVPNDCYPLVITYRKLLTMLDGSVAESFFSRAGGPETQAKCSNERSGISQRVVVEVEYERFSSDYWPHLNAKLRKDFDPSSIYTEIMSQIKGSLEALQNPTGILSQSQYLAVAERRTSVYDRRQRENIYSLFEQYERSKKEAQTGSFEYDNADLVLHLYGQVQKQGFRGQKMHFVYVDEVQDFTQAQIALFKCICSNIEEGFMFAGDTAQTIARGVGFHFEDVRRLYYEEFLGERAEIQQPNRCSKKVPDVFQLSMNFRTHMGIVSIANSVVQLLVHFFPHSVDKLDPEISLLDGEAPVFIHTDENCDLLTSLFNRGSRAGGGGCEFGAEQVILVRDLKAKDQLVTRLGHAGLVLSVHECKGLEFQDVLLYNFFSDSPFQNKWRVIYAFLQEACSSQTWSQPSGYPSFDVRKHNLLCSELKQLYVVLTRARQRLWIYDECVENHQPMLDYWESSGLVEIKCLDDSLAAELQGKSSAEHWRRRGIQMFNSRNYSAAFLCFERAGDTRKAQQAKAEDLQITANNMRVTNPPQATRLICEAAQIYLSLEKEEAAAKCYVKFGDFKNAAIIFGTVCRPPKLEDAGNYFMKAQCWKEAAQIYLSLEKEEAAANCYIKSGDYKNAALLFATVCKPPKLEDAGDYFMKAKCLKEAATAYSHVSISKCLDACWHGNLLDLGVSFIKQQRFKTKLESRHKNAEDDTAKFEFLKKCACNSHQEKNVKQMMKFVLLFPSLAAQRSFLRRRDYYDQLLQIEEAAGNYEMAAELAEADGDFHHAARLLVKCGLYSSAVEKLLHHVSMEILWKNGARGWPEGLTPETAQDLEEAEALIRRETFHPCGAARLLHEIRILKSLGCAGIDALKDSWERAQSLDDLRVKVVSSLLLLPKILGQMRVNLEQYCRSDGNLHSSTLSEHLPILVRVWLHWSNQIIMTINAIERLQRGRCRAEDEPILDYVYTYLGVQKHSQPHTLVVEDTNVQWLENVCSNSMNSSVKQSRRWQVSITEFAPIALKFFGGQLLESGLSGVSFILSRAYSLTVLCHPPNSSDTQKHPKSRTSVLVQVLLDSINVFRGVLKARTWDLQKVALVKEMMKACAAHLYEAMVTHYPKVNNVINEVLKARESSDVQQFFESLAVNLSHDRVVSSGPAERHSSYVGTDDELGRLVTLMPFLGMDSFKRIDILLSKSLTDSSSKLRLWRAAHWQHCQRFTPSVDNHRCSFRSDHLISYIRVLRSIFSIVTIQTSENPAGSMTPLVLLTLIERGVVAACAYATHLTTLILPQNLVLDHMAGEHQKPFYTMLLNSTCDNACSKLPGMLLDVVDLILLWLFQVQQSRSWLQRSRLDAAIYMPVVTLRLLNLLVAICINTRDGRIYEKVIGALTNLSGKKSSVLKGLPFQFLEEFQPLLVGRLINKLMILSTYSRALSSIADPIIVLRRTKSASDDFPDWELRHLRVGVVNVELQSVDGSQCSFNIDGLRDTPDAEDPEWEANEEGTVRDDVLETGLTIWEGTAVKKGSSYVPKTVGEKSEETGAVQLQKSAPCSMMSDRVTLADGTTLLRKFVEQLNLKLRVAREGLQVPWTPLERYQHDARSAFRRHRNHNKSYAEFFILTACTLRVDVDTWLLKLHEALDNIKDTTQRLKNRDELLEKFSDHMETLEEAVKCLNPMYQKHEEGDERWLREQVEEVTKLLQSGRIQLKEPLQMLFSTADKRVTTSKKGVQGPGPSNNNKAAGKNNKKQNKRNKKH